MLLLQGEVVRVTLGGVERLNKETGETSKTDPVCFILHAASQDSEADLKVEKLKLKDNSQAEAFRKVQGKTVSVPVNIWATEGGSHGFWLSKGILPTVLPDLKV